MTTRRKFGLGGIAAIIAAGRAPAALVRSMLGARQAITARRSGGGGGWANPYDTSALIAMWDGEWNVAGGVHDATATTWLDIVGGRMLSLSGSASFGANYMETTDDVSGAIGDFDLSAAYFEMVMYVSLTADWFSVFDGLSGKWVWGEPQNYADQNAGISYLYYGGAAELHADGIMHIGMSLDGSVCTVNGRACAVDTSYSDGAIGPFSIFGNVDNIGEERCCRGKCYSARFYSAIPTAAQRAANLAIDQERFNMQS